MGWIIAAVIALVIIGILAIPANVRLRANGGGVSAVLKILFFKYALYPLEDKPKKKKRAKKAKKKTVGTKAAPTQKSKKKNDLGSILDLVKSIALPIVNGLGKHLRIRLKKLHVIIGCEDAAETAVLYGIACNACDELLEILGRAMKYSADSGAVYIDTDYVSEKTSFDIDVVFKLRVYGALSILLKALMGYIKK